MRLSMHHSFPPDQVILAALSQCAVPIEYLIVNSKLDPKFLRAIPACYQTTDETAIYYRLLELTRRFRNYGH